MLDFFFYVSAMAFVGKTSPSNDGSHWKWIVFVHASEMNNPTFERAPITESVFTLKLLSTRTSSRALFDDYAALIRHEIYLHDGIRVYRGRTVVMHVEWKIHWTFFRTTFDVLRYYLGINKFFFFFFLVWLLIGTYRKAVTRLFASSIFSLSSLSLSFSMPVGKFEKEYI